MLVDFLAENAGGLVAANIGIRSFLLSFFDGVEADKFGAHAGGIGLAAEFGIGAAKGEIDLPLIWESLAGDFEFGESLGGAVGVDIEQAEKVVCEGESRAELDGLLSVFNAISGIEAVADSGNLQERADVLWVLLQFLLEFGHGRIDFVSFEQTPAKGKMKLRV